MPSDELQHRGQRRIVYVDGDASTNTIESFFAVFKRGYNTDGNEKLIKEWGL